MTSTAYTPEVTEAARPRGPGLVAAELLKLRKRRSLVLTSVALTIVPMVIGFVVTTILHVSDPAKHVTAGGVDHFVGAFGLFSMLVAVAAVVVGATVGSADLGAGVFRELVVTGRSRWHLFAARVPGGLAFLLVPVLVGFAVVAVATTALAGSAEAPTAELIVTAGGWVLLVAASTFALALGVSSVVGSRAAVAILLAWQLAVAPLLLGIGALGSIRQGFLAASLQHLQPAALEGQPAVATSTATAVVVLVVWSAVPLVVGAWRTATRDA